MALFAAILLPLGFPDARGAATDDATAITRVLDDFHRAAAEADEARYFGHFAPGAIFLGTDPAERWTVEAFRKWASPYFQRKSAWTFVPRDRHVTVAPGGRTAWFDEVAESRHYGACRGTGVLIKIGDTWKIAQYNLTLPVPNDRMKEVVRLIRAAAGDEKTAPVVLVVRHAEKDMDPGDGDPPLSAAGRERAAALARLLGKCPIDAVLATKYRRTRDTVAVAARAAGVEVGVHPARDTAGLVRILTAKHAGKTVLVAGHSNTVPDLLRRLGVKKPPRLGHGDYGDLFVVVPAGDDGVRCLRLRFGD
jgi:phosphohistidine phosphatase SixA